MLSLTVVSISHLLLQLLLYLLLKTLTASYFISSLVKFMFRLVIYRTCYIFAHIFPWLSYTISLYLLPFFPLRKVVWRSLLTSCD